jgi:uncharacterized membrane protein YidH (DUF202 family)
MSNPATVSNADRFEVQITADSHFAWLRTRLAVERTMMSWLRTAVSWRWSLAWAPMQFDCCRRVAHAPFERQHLNIGLKEFVRGN